MTCCVIIFIFSIFFTFDEYKASKKNFLAEFSVEIKDLVIEYGTKELVL
jgi:hypothetical protein